MCEGNRLQKSVRKVDQNGGLRVMCMHLTRQPSLQDQIEEMTRLVASC
jgi:hypothetical protein